MKMDFLAFFVYCIQFYKKYIKFQETGLLKLGFVLSYTVLAFGLHLYKKLRK